MSVTDFSLDIQARIFFLALHKVWFLVSRARRKVAKRNQEKRVWLLVSLSKNSKVSGKSGG
jgi:hypothetical protein